MFSGLDATYVRSVFDGLEQALRAEREFDWAPALALAEWAISQPRSAGDPDGNDADRDPHWGWARKSVASLLGFGRRKINIAERPRVWRIISALIEDPDPTPEHEREYGGSNMDPMTMSANTVRGEAMHAVFEYAVWVRQHLAKVDPGTTANLESMPDVKAALEGHLDPAKDASTTVRAVYGMRFPTLLWLDRDWIQRNLAMLFPGDPALSALRAALWEAALTNSASAPLWDVLQQEYRRGVDALAGATSLDDEVPDHVDHLVAHVMLLYLHPQDRAGTGRLRAPFLRDCPRGRESVRHRLRWSRPGWIASEPGHSGDGLAGQGPVGAPPRRSPKGGHQHPSGGLVGGRPGASAAGFGRSRSTPRRGSSESLSSLRRFRASRSLPGLG